MQEKKKTITEEEHAEFIRNLQKKIQQEIHVFAQEGMGRAMLEVKDAANDRLQEFIDGKDNNPILSQMKDILVNLNVAFFNGLISMGLRIPGTMYLQALQEARDEILLNVMEMAEERDKRKMKVRKNN